MCFLVVDRYSAVNLKGAELFLLFPSQNLAVIFGKALFGEDELPKDGDLRNFKPGKDTVVEDLINYAPLLFSEETSSAPTLPAGAALSRSGSLSYVPTGGAGIGSHHTRAKLPKPHANVRANSGGFALPPLIVERVDANSSSPPLPPGAASPISSLPHNFSRDLGTSTAGGGPPPALPPRRLPEDRVVNVPGEPQSVEHEQPVTLNLNTPGEEVDAQLGGSPTTTATITHHEEAIKTSPPPLVEQADQPVNVENAAVEVIELNGESHHSPRQDDSGQTDIEVPEESKVDKGKGKEKALPEQD